MGRTTRRRPTGPRRATIAAFALILGGAGLVGVNVYASATESGSGAAQPTTLSAMGGTIDCPDVGSKLTQVPEEAKADVDRQLAALDQQIAEAYQRLQSATQAQRQDSGFTDDTIMNPLKEKRTQTLDGIADAVDRVADRPQGLDSLAACTLRTADASTGTQGGQSGAPGNGGQAGNGPVAADYADITTVQPNSPAPDLKTFASSGSFTSSCGVNAGGLFNSDNVIVAPGVSNGAHHFHDYVGNQSNNAFASDDDLANADTSCADQGDKSTYYWPVLRLQNGTQERDANSPGGGIEGNAGKIVTPKEVTLTFIGNPRGEVTAMPRFLRIITGDAKAFVNGTANANASWSCTGFEDRQLKDKYPLCPQGSDVVRTFRFQSCWDGRNIDSANHRTHVAFADASGNCPDGFKPIPQLVQRIVYDVDAPSLQDGGRTTPLFAVDSFPEQLHKPVTDHGDFINVFDEGLMRQMVDCINDGRQCGAGSDDGASQPPTEQPSEQPSGQPTQQPSDAPTDSASDNPTDEPSQQPSEQPTDEQPAQSSPATQPPADGTGEQTAAPTTAAPQTEPANDGRPTAGSDAPRVYTSTSPDRSTASAPAQGNAGDDSTTAQPQATDATANAPIAASQTTPQAVQGGDLAETGTTLWPAVAGTVLLVAGLVVLASSKRRLLR
ncbi:DUF1996 domain-containing protein [Streptomyces sp. 7R007]